VENYLVSVRRADGHVVQVGITPDVVAAARILPHAPERYFLTEGSTFLSISELVLGRARPEGIANAVKLMSAAYRGQQSRRPPIKVQRHHDGTYFVLDGNSTTIIAMLAGWPLIPCTVVNSGHLKIPAALAKRCSSAL
jgi:hypothetical protein